MFKKIVGRNSDLNIDFIFRSLITYYTNYKFDEMDGKKPFNIPFNLKFKYDKKGVRISCNFSVDHINHKSYRNMKKKIRMNLNLFYEILAYTFPVLMIKCHANINYKSSYTDLPNSFTESDIVYKLVKINIK